MRQPKNSRRVTKWCLYRAVAEGWLKGTCYRNSQLRRLLNSKICLVVNFLASIHSSISF